MATDNNKFIAPGAWFSMSYPADWREFDDGEDSFLFYNPNRWTGNFRISAFRGADNHYAEQVISEELRNNPKMKAMTVADRKCAYICETFTEEGQAYENHQWLTGINDVVFEVSFATQEGASIQEAIDVIATLQLRYEGVKYHAELIAVRLSEIVQIDEAYDWVQAEVKNRFAKDFRGEMHDIMLMQRLVDNGGFSPKKRDPWLALGITLCVILTNEADGYEWRTLIDGNREAPVLVTPADGQMIDPMKLVWSRVKNGEKVDLKAIYESLI